MCDKLQRLRSHSHPPQPLELTHHPLQLLHERTRPRRPKHIHQLPVIPQRPVFSPLKPLKNLVPLQAIVRKNLPRIRQFIRRRNQPHIRRFFRHARNVRALPLGPTPFLPARLVRIRAPVHNPRHFPAKLFPDLIQPRQPALILHRIMQQRRNHLILAPAMLDHDRRHAQQMPHVRLPLALPPLKLMQLRRIAQRLHKPLRQHRRPRVRPILSHDFLRCSGGSSDPFLCRSLLRLLIVFCSGESLDSHLCLLRRPRWRTPHPLTSHLFPRDPQTTAAASCSTTATSPNTTTPTSPSSQTPHTTPYT